MVENFDAKKFVADSQGYRGPKNEEGFKHGIGFMSLDGNKHTGEFRRGQRHGIGKSITAT